jgi:hypothetical protein
MLMDGVLKLERVYEFHEDEVVEFLDCFESELLLRRQSFTKHAFGQAHPEDHGPIMSRISSELRSLAVDGAIAIPTLVFHQILTKCPAQSRHRYQGVCQPIASNWPDPMTGFPDLPTMCKIMVRSLA